MSTSTQTTAAPSASNPASRKIDALLAHYGDSHQNPRNEVIHYFAIPLIVFSLVGMLHWIHPTLALITIAGSIVYYARLSLVFTVVMSLTGAVSLYVASLLGSALLPVCVAVFVVSWIFQFIGHKIEGKKPSFFEDLQYLLVGPLFVLSKLFLKLGVKW